MFGLCGVPSVLHKGTRGAPDRANINAADTDAIATRKRITRFTHGDRGSAGFLPNDLGLGGKVDRGTMDIFFLGPDGVSDGRPENVFVPGSGDGVRLKS